jgi:hypothetical protein
MRPEAVAEIALHKLGKRTTVVAGLLNRLITASTRFTPRWMNSLIFGNVVGGMLKNATAGTATAAPVPTTAPRTLDSPVLGSRIMANDRRQFLAATATLGVGTLGLSPGQARGDDQPKDDKKDQPGEEVGAAEDLMRDHGVLNRILLIYEEGLRRLTAGCSGVSG